jgi:molybdate transport system regulatory protein
MSQPSPIRLRLVFGHDKRHGPGKADLLERICETGSISAAGRGMKMSYKWAGLLVEEMNAAFHDPLGVPVRGGVGGGGEDVPRHCRALEIRLSEIGAAEIRVLRDMLSDMSDRKWRLRCSLSLVDIVDRICGEG